MKKNAVYPVLLLGCFICSGMADPLLQQKDPKTSGNILSFQTSFSPHISVNSYFVPLIGIYGDPYLFLKKIGYIVLNPTASLKHIDQDIFLNVISEKKLQLINLQIMVLGKKSLDTVDSTNTVFNMVYHEIAQGLLSPKTIQNVFDIKNIKNELLNINMNMGIFAPKGVRSVPFSFNSFSGQNVHVHNGGKTLAFSPDNARFKIEGTSISTFWAVMYYAPKGYIHITYFILANTQPTEDQIQDICNQSKTVKELVQNLRVYSFAFDGIEKEYLANAANTIERLVSTPPKSVPEQKTVEPKLPAIQPDTLQKSLTILSEKLNHLKKILT